MLRAFVFLTVAVGVLLSDVASAQRWGDRFPNVQLTTQHGEPVRFYDDLVKGKIVAINLIYTTCKYACPLETARLRQIYKLLGDRMGKDVFFYSITIDPDHDTPAVLKEYARQYDVGPGWFFLTGNRGDIDQISKRLGLAPPPDPTNPDGHIPTLLIGNEVSGQWMRTSALAAPSSLARTIGDWLTSWRGTPKAVAPVSADAAPALVDRTQYLFAKRCAACHTIGAGEALGPDLAGVTSRRDRPWLTRFITAPERMNAAGDPIAVALRSKYKEVRMPNLGLTEADAKALIEYIDTEGRKNSPAAASATRSPAPDRASLPRAGASISASVVTPYLRIHQALYGDRVEGVKESAAEILTAASALPRHGAVAALAGSLQRAEDLVAARRAFAGLTDLLLAEGKDIQTERGDVHVAYCPMAGKYWLQAGKTIQNPYYGQKMADCGRIVSTSDR